MKTSFVLGSQKRSPLYVITSLFVAALTSVGCSKQSSSNDVTTTYKYDPLSQVTSPTEVGKKEVTQERQPASIGTAGKTYIVQIGAFTKKENAERLSAQLKAKNYPVFVKTLDHQSLGQMYLVRLNPFTDRAEANRFATQLTNSEKLKPTIIIPKR